VANKVQQPHVSEFNSQLQFITSHQEVAFPSKGKFNRDEGDKGDTGNSMLHRRHSGQSRTTVHSKLFPSLEGRVKASEDPESSRI
jgi:hypothetical protein